jgi:hypothetical protein
MHLAMAAAAKEHTVKASSLPSIHWKTEGCITNTLAAALKPMYHIEFRQAQQ